MKLKNILTVPFALVADAVTLANFGDRSYTQQVFDADRRQRKIEEEIRLIEALMPLLVAALKNENKQ